MEILELNLKHFGKFQEHKIELHPGVNIIYGGNETGKSTIHAFIRAMFFGIERSRGKAGRKDEYQLRQPWDNPSYFAGTMRVKYEGKIYRIERNFNKNEREVHLICETTGEELSMKDGELSGLLAGMSEAAFRNTVFISQAGSETDAGLAEELQKFMVNFQETGDGSLDVSRALDKLKDRKKKLEAKKKQEQELLDEKLARKQMEMDYVTRELEQKRKRFIPSQKEMEERNRQQESEKREEQPGQGLGREIAQTETAGNKKTEEGNSSGFYNRFLIWVNILLFISGALGFACSLFALNLAVRVGMFLAGSIFLFLFGMTLRYTLRVRHTPIRHFTKNPDIRMDLCKEQDQKQLEAMLHLAEKNLEEGKMRWKKEEYQKEIQEKKVQQEVIREELEELYGQREQLLSYDREMEAIDLAMLRIRELSAKIYREAGTEFSQTASGILAELTEGRYTQLALDEKMEVRINTPSRLLYLYQVSYGTMNQVYFALRMAAGKLLAFGQPVPIILDEVFAMYDDERLEAALRWLDSSGRQVILFSCQTREKIFLDRIRQR